MVRRIRAKLVLQLRSEGLSGRQISTHGISRKSVAAVLEAAEREDLSFADVADLDEAEVYGRLFPGRGDRTSIYVQPDWAQIHRELARVGVTLKLLHSEYVDRHKPRGGLVMGYDRFCTSYRTYVLMAGVASRVGHKAGQAVEVDWAGPTMTLTNPVTGVEQKVYLFIACLPFSRYAFVEPCTDMTQASWLTAHVAMFDYFGGSVPRIICDNLKTGVIARPRDGEIVLNDSYRELAGHYSAAALPARVGKPKDKASVENTVWHVATRINAKLRDRPFASLAELRQAIRVELEAYNGEPFQKRPGSRRSIFESEEQPLLRPLPAVPYEIATWVYGRKVAKNSHVVWQKNSYSVPYPNIGKTVDLRVTTTMVEIYDGHDRLTSHVRVPAGTTGAYRTHDSDLPEGKGYQPWDEHRARDWATRIGPNTLTVIDRIFEAVPIAEQGIDPALAVLRLSRRFTAGRVEAACKIALEANIRSPRYSHLRPVLDTAQDKAGTDAPSSPAEGEGYVRGAAYYAGDRSK